MEIPLSYITTGVKGGLRDGFKTVIYGLDEEGWMWKMDPKTEEWQRISNPRTGTGKERPDEPGEHVPSWKDL